MNIVNFQEEAKICSTVFIEVGKIQQCVRAAHPQQSQGTEDKHDWDGIQLTDAVITSLISVL